MVEISICGMCKHYIENAKDNACLAYPNGRKNYDDLFPLADEECANGIKFSPKPEFESIWDDSMYKRFSKKDEKDDFEIVIPLKQKS